MALSQNQRDRIAIRTVLSQMGSTTFQEIALRAGEGLSSPLMEMVADGEVIRTPGIDGQASTFSLPE